MSGEQQRERERMEEEFLKHGLQYYIAARFAAATGLLPVTGNLYHHAIEMLLKAGLARTMSPEEMRDKFWHRLPKAWKAFRIAFPGPDLSRFDKTIADVNRWEKIRYPEEIVRSGARIDVVWAPTPDSGPSSLPMYRADGRSIDELVIAIFGVLSKNLWALLLPFTGRDEIRRVITRYHPAPEHVLPPTNAEPTAPP
jgi:hypothetical protein